VHALVRRHSAREGADRGREAGHEQ
jgi:hypothetical protein